VSTVDAQESKALIAAGLLCAYWLNMPVKIAGRDVLVSEAMAKALGADESIAEPAEAPVAKGDRFGVARRAAHLMKIAEVEINKLGIEIGALPSPPPLPPEPARVLSAPAAPPAQPPRFDVVERDGALIINEAWEIRSTDGKSDGSTWIVVDINRNQFEAWHPSRAAALEWLRQKIAPETERTPHA
jgi:hypothetical protein